METEEYHSMRLFEDDYWWYRSLRSVVAENLPDAKSVLDAGCGTGGMLKEIASKKVVGIDSSPYALTHTRERGFDLVVRGSVCALPFPPESFDAVLCLDVIYHRGVADDGAAVKEFARVLRPGGKVILHAPAYGWLHGSHDEKVHGARRYTTKRVGELVRGAGLEICKLSYRNLAALPAAIVFRRFLPGRSGSDLAPLPGWLNKVLLGISLFENRVLRGVSLPAGLSVFCIAKKPL